MTTQPEWKQRTIALRIKLALAAAWLLLIFGSYFHAQMKVIVPKLTRITKSDIPR